MSYYDLDAILTDAEKVPCKFELDVPDLGYLDNNPSQGLKAQTPVSLPLWLAELLALSSRTQSSNPEDSAPFLTLEMPKALSNEVVSALKADPRAVALRDQTHNMYGLATRMLDLFEEPEMCAVLRRTFVTRAAETALHARKAGATDDVVRGEGFLSGLEEWERLLFRRAHDGNKACKEWMEGVKK
ncbi:DNA replication complex gins protein psf3 [Apiospora rasikravindrae]|uniref:DNA replication complex GINS protein PSF3 n=1 Tax=Apiospora rasikravindrae TaxID=990691 RepID=A0ABR1T067_9PEZI